MSVYGFSFDGSSVQKYDYEELDNKPSIPQIDTTLSNSGKAADAQAVGSAIQDVRQDLSDDIADLSTEVAGKQDPIVAGTGITISGTTINHTNSVTRATRGITIPTRGNVITDIPYFTYNTTGHMESSGVRKHTLNVSSEVAENDDYLITSGAVYTAIQNAISAATVAITTAQIDALFE